MNWLWLQCLWLRVCDSCTVGGHKTTTLHAEQLLLFSYIRATNQLILYHKHATHLTTM